MNTPADMSKNTINKINEKLNPKKPDEFALVEFIGFNAFIRGRLDCIFTGTKLFIF